MQHIIKALKAVGEPTRLRIIAALSHFELTVTELVALLNQSQPRVSRHLKLLLEAGLITRVQEGSWVFQRLNESPEALNIISNLVRLIDFNDPILKQDSERLKQIKANNAKRAADYFAQHAGDWDKIRNMIGSDQAIEQSMLEFTKNQSFNNMIDMGTGTGRILNIFAPQTRKATGYDSSQEMLKLARANLEQAKLNHCQVRLGDITALPVDAPLADLITVHQVLHYLDRPFAVIEQAKRLLTPNGVILIVDFAKHQHDFLRTEHAHRRLGFSNSEVEFWCENTELSLSSTQTLTHNAKHNGLDVVLWALKHS